MSDSAQSRGREASSSSNQTKYGGLRNEFEEPTQQLLPGIPDDITEYVITPKLRWATLSILPSVNRAWEKAFQSLLGARLRSLATETDVLVESLGFVGRDISPFNGRNREKVPLRAEKFHLRSVSDGFAYPLPPLPNLGAGYAAGSGFPNGCRCVFLDGKVYVLGGDQYDGYVHVRRDEVYVLDLAGLRRWEQCESMKCARRWASQCESMKYARRWGSQSESMNFARRWAYMFGVYTIRGKIYVCGGHHNTGYKIDVIEVYDPDTSTWDQIEMPPYSTYNQMIPGFQDAFISSIKALQSNMWTKSHATTP